MLTLAVALLRRRWAPLAGAFVALALGASLVSGVGTILAGAQDVAPEGPARLKAAPVVVAGASDLRTVEGRGEDREIVVEPNLRRAAVDPALADRIAALPGVVVEVAGDGAPEVSRGDRFFYTGGGDRRRPFATIVSRDVPGFDEASRLDRPGVFRLNVELGRRGFTAEFGYPPAELPERLPGVDAARLDTVIPHPAYGTYGWASVLNPGPASLPEVDRLLAAALARRRRAPLADG